MFARYAAAVDAAMESGDLTRVYIYSRMSARIALDASSPDRPSAVYRRAYWQTMLTAASRQQSRAVLACLVRSRRA